MRDRRSTRDHRQPLAVSPHSVPGTLGSWCQSLADARGIRSPTDRSVPGLSGYLDTHLDWITRQDWVADLATELRELHTQLSRGRHDWRPIGDCPVLTDTGACGATLLASLDLGTARCWVCGAEWPCDRWLYLGSVLAGA